MLCDSDKQRVLLALLLMADSYRLQDLEEQRLDILATAERVAGEFGFGADYLVAFSASVSSVIESSAG